MSQAANPTPKKNVVISKKNLKKLVVIAVAALLFGAVVGYALLQGTRPQGQQIDHDGYQAVYTTSGQLFFGKLQNAEGNYLVLKTPYTAQDVAPNEADPATPQEADAATSLLPVSSQLYGPDESMAIRAEQVTFWQNLRDDSKVSQALREKE